MKITKHEARKKMLKDFPWLWAIRPRWYSTISVRVEFASKSMFDLMQSSHGKIKEGEFEVWVKVSGAKPAIGKGEEVRNIDIKLPFDKRVMAGEIVFDREGAEYQYLEFVVIVHNIASNIHDVIIYRPPKGWDETNYWVFFYEMCRG